MTTATLAPIDQHQRRALLRRIVRGDRSAASDLADLYAAAGYHANAAAYRKALDNTESWNILWENAQTWEHRR